MLGKISGGSIKITLRLQFTQSLGPNENVVRDVTLLFPSTTKKKETKARSYVSPMYLIIHLTTIFFGGIQKHSCMADDAQQTRKKKEQINQQKKN